MKKENVTDVTDNFETGILDDELLEIKRCECGAEFPKINRTKAVKTDFWISTYKDEAHECPSCNTKYYFKNKITIYKVQE